MSDEKVIPTPDEIRATFSGVRHKIGCMDLCLDATIDDYPIGRHERGKCRLQVERAAGTGYRSIRTTTNKFGRWCAPKKSTYTNNVTVVVANLDEEHQHAWLSVGSGGGFEGAHVCLRYANGDGLALAKCWRYDPPRRKDHHYSSQTSKSMSILDIADGKLPEYEEPQPHVFKADSLEECDAWDVWVEELKSVQELLRNAWAAAETVPI
jgi:hypothetical protein